MVGQNGYFVNPQKDGRPSWVGGYGIANWCPTPYGLEMAKWEAQDFTRYGEVGSNGGGVR